MDKDLEAILIKDFPTFFREMYGDPRETCMHWGCSVGEGWFDLIYGLCLKIKEENPSPDFKFAQIKEKFGHLTVYADGGNKKIYELIENAWKESEKTCEICGTKGNVTLEGRWVKALCGDCRKKK